MKIKFDRNKGKTIHVSNLASGELAEIINDNFGNYQGSIVVRQGGTLRTIECLLGVASAKGDFWTDINSITRPTAVVRVLDPEERIVLSN